MPRAKTSEKPRDPPCLVAALEYLRLGWSALPLCEPTHEVGPEQHRKTCKRAGKAPLVPWGPYQDRLPSEKELRLWWNRWPGANVGIALGPVSSLCALDIDGPEGVALLNALAQAHAPGPMADTLAFRTGSGGRLLFKLPEGCDPPQRSFRDSEGRELVRFQSRGGQTVAPPSLHPNGSHYEWCEECGPGEIEPLELPDWLLALVEGTTTEQGRPGGGVPAQAVPSAPDPPRQDTPMIERARAYLKACDPAISGQNGHGQTFKIVCKLVHGFGLDEETAFGLLLTEYNPRCQPPWSEGELRHKVKSAREKGSAEDLASQPRRMDGAERVTRAGNPCAPEPDERDPQAAQEEDEPIATLADVIAAVGRVTWAWDGWIPIGVLTALAAEPGCGKTRFCGDLARRLYHGLPWPDGTPTPFPPGSPVLWVASDSQHAQLASIAEEFGIPPECVYLNAPRSEPFAGTMLDATPDLKRFERHIQKLRPVLVFIDTTLNSTDRGCTKPEDAKAYFVPLMEIARRQQVAIVCVTHLNASGKALGLRIRGQCRVVIHLEQPDEEQKDRRRLEVTKSIAQYPAALGVTMGSSGNEYDLDPPSAGEGRPGGDSSESKEALNRLVEVQVWLVEQLRNGPVRVPVLRDRAEAKGYSSRTLYKARNVLELEEFEQEDTRGKWWRMPGEG